MRRSVALLRKAMDFERAFVKAGGLLIAGLDPTGNGGIVAGFGDLREVELLVEPGFTPLEAIKIASFNGAKFLGEDAHIGSIAVGKQADLMVVKGNPALNISEIEKVKSSSRMELATTQKTDPVGSRVGGNSVICQQAPTPGELADSCTRPLLK